MNNPKVSVIIPVYGVEKYIERCARSLFEQTIDSIEYIFIDDCTPDNSMKILETVMSEYPNRISQVKCHQMDKNSGQAAVRKWGIEHATGEYVIHCDSDDWMEKDMYKEMYLLAKENNYDIVRCDFIREFKDYQRRNVQLPTNIYSDKYSLMSKTLLGNELTSLCDKLVKRVLIQDSRIRYPNNNMQEDHVLTLQYMFYSTSIGYINKPFYHYCYNPTSITRKIRPEMSIARMEQVYNNTLMIQAFLEDNELDRELNAELIVQKYNCRNHIRDIINKKIYYKKWKSIFPEIDKKILLIKKIPIRVKLDYILVKLGIYHIIHNLYSKIKHA